MCLPHCHFLMSQRQIDFFQYDNRISTLFSLKRIKYVKNENVWESMCL